MDIGLNTYSIRQEAEALASNVDDLPKAIVALCKDADIKRAELFDKHFRKENVAAVKQTLEDNGIEFFAFGAHCKVLVEPRLVEEKAEEYKEWLELAHKHEVPYIRFQMDSGGMPKIWPPFPDFSEEEWAEYNQQIDKAIEFVRPSMERLEEMLDNYEVIVGLETHGSFSSNYIFHEKFEKEFQHDKYEWIFDIGNFKNEDMRFKSLDVLKKNICYLHAASRKYNDEGLPVGISGLNYPRAVNVLKEAGFNGTWSIEFKGSNGLLGVHQSCEYINYSFAKAKGKDYGMKADFPTNEELIKKYKV